jgi:hypothetical protein
VNYHSVTLNSSSVELTGLEFHIARIYAVTAKMKLRVYVQGIVSRDWKRLQMVLLDKYEVLDITAWGLLFFKSCYHI